MWQLAAVLRTEPRALHMLDKCSPQTCTSSALCLLFCLRDGVWLCCPGWSWTLPAAKASQKLEILLPQPSKWLELQTRVTGSGPLSCMCQSEHCTSGSPYSPTIYAPIHLKDDSLSCLLHCFSPVISRAWHCIWNAAGPIKDPTIDKWVNTSV